MYIHQTWCDDNLPSNWYDNTKKWKDFAKEHKYEYKFWTDQDNVDFLNQNDYSDILTLFMSGQLLGIHKAHIMRTLYMKHFGGVYLDITLGPGEFQFTQLLFQHLQQPYECLFVPKWNGVLNTTYSQSFFISEPNHPLWDKMLAEQIDRCKNMIVEENGSILRNSKVHDVTGHNVFSTIIGLGIKHYHYPILVLPYDHVFHQDNPYLVWSNILDSSRHTWKQWDSHLTNKVNRLWKYKDLVLIVLLILFVCIFALSLMNVWK